MSKKERSPLIQKTILLMPEEVHRRLKHLAAAEGCSMSWIVTELVMEALGMSSSDIPGVRPAKSFMERKRQREQKE